jgi:hypothetical protein
MRQLPTPLALRLGFPSLPYLVFHNPARLWQWQCKDRLLCWLEHHTEPGGSISSPHQNVHTCPQPSTAERLGRELFSMGRGRSNRPTDTNASAQHPLQAWPNRLSAGLPRPVCQYVALAYLVSRFGKSASQLQPMPRPILCCQHVIPG